MSDMKFPNVGKRCPVCGKGLITYQKATGGIMGGRSLEIVDCDNKNCKIDRMFYKGAR